MPDNKPRLTAGQIEAYARRCALANQGGDWAKDYTTEQRDFWRDFVNELSLDIWGDGFKVGYDAGHRDGVGYEL